MKKYFILTIACIFILSISVAWAGDDSADSSSSSVSGINFQDNSVNTSIESRQHMNPGWMIPTSTLQPYKEESPWSVYNGEPFNKVISAKRLKADESWFERIGLSESETIWDHAEENDLPIRLITLPDKKKTLAKYNQAVGNLHYMGAITFELEPEIYREFEKGLHSVLARVKKKTGATKVIVLVKTRPMSKSRSIGIGSGLIGGKTMGSGGSDNVMGAVAGGTGANWQKAYTDIEPFLKVLCFR